MEIVALNICLDFGEIQDHIMPKYFKQILYLFVLNYAKLLSINCKALLERHHYKKMGKNTLDFIKYRTKILCLLSKYKRFLNASKLLYFVVIL